MRRRSKMLTYKKIKADKFQFYRDDKLVAVVEKNVIRVVQPLDSYERKEIKKAAGLKYATKPWRRKNSGANSFWKILKKGVDSYNLIGYSILKKWK
jgi:hypothetical protein